jgi:hypothetical protein
VRKGNINQRYHQCQSRFSVTTGVFGNSAAEFAASSGAMPAPARSIRRRNVELVQGPARRSFGTRLIETLGMQLKGEVQLTYEPGGFVYALDVPLSSLTSPAVG